LIDVRKYSPTDPIVREEPYPYYAELRKGPGATYVPADDLWVIPRFNDVGMALRDTTNFSSKGLWALFGGIVSARERPRPNVREFAATQPRMIIALDPPDHIAMRRLVSNAFSKKVIDAGYTDLIRSICNELIDDMLEKREGGTIDLFEAFHHPLPIRVIADILGVHPARRHEFKQWSDILIERQSGRGNSPEEQAAIKNMTAYFAEILRYRKEHRGDDLISMIITGNEGSDEFLTEWDLINFCGLLLSAGNETTTNLLGNMFNAFFLYPDQARKAWHIDNIALVVEEVLRYDSTVQGLVRLTNADVEVGDTVIPKDSIAIVLLGSANRDETRWPDGDVFDIERRSVPHFGFGNGIHSCLGSSLARLEAAVALDVLRTRLKSVEPAGRSIRATNVILRGFSSMPARVKAA